MIVTEQPDRPCVTASGDPHRPIRAALSDGRVMDMTHDELIALQHEIRAYLLYPVPGPPVRRMSNSGG